MRVGVTGHQSIKPEIEGWVRCEILRVLSTLPPPLIGLTNLAAGTDQLFADAILDIGGQLEVVVPFKGYELAFANPSARHAYERLVAVANRVSILAGGGSNEESYLEAGKEVARTSELLVAVWDGLPARGIGGTADVVAYASSLGRPIVQINPNSMSTSELSGRAQQEK